MKRLWLKFKNIWTLLHKDIYVGDLRTQNMKACMFVGIFVFIASCVLTTMNMIANRHPITVASTSILALSGLVIVYLIRKGHKMIPTYMMILICLIIFTYYVFSGQTGGTTAMWTILVPLGVGYFGKALYGIYCGIYFQTLLVVLFYTTLRSFFTDKYARFFMDRFPVLYFLNLALMSICLINYHISVLKLLDAAEELRKAKEEAERANRGKSDFLSNMSHEIRTPINAVLGMNEMILRESLSSGNHLPTDEKEIRKKFADIAKYSGNIGSAGNNLLYLINDILDFSKIESGKMQLVESDYMFSSVLNDVSNMIYFKAKDKGLTFEVDVDNNIPDGLHGDEVRVRQIITNILNNAVKYTKEGSIHLRVKGEENTHLSANVFNLMIIVSDTGIGIREEDIGKLFNKFERMDLDHNSTIEGTGLGLAITKNLLEMMGGNIEVHSVYGEGSVFTIFLPQIIVSKEPVGDFRRKFDESIEAMEEYEESFRAPDAHVLIVDDTRMNLMVVQGLLKDTELKIDTALSGTEAIELAYKNTYDLVLMDQRMPGMGGTETMKHIKEECPAYRNIPFICLTADAISGAKERYLAEGFNNYLTKPIDYRALEKMLIKHLPLEKVVLSPKKMQEVLVGEDYE